MTEQQRKTLAFVSRWDRLPPAAQLAITAALAEIDRLRAELAAAQAEPPRPAAMLWVDPCEWIAFERYEDAAAERERLGAAMCSRCEPPLMVVKTWTWHPARAAEGEGETS